MLFAFLTKVFSVFLHLVGAVNWDDRQTRVRHEENIVALFASNRCELLEPNSQTGWQFGNVAGTEGQGH